MKALVVLLILAASPVAHAATTTPHHRHHHLSKRADYQHRAETELNSIEQKINGLKFKASQAGADTREHLRENIVLLEKKLNVARRRLVQVKGSSNEQWQKVRKGLDSAVIDLNKSYHRVVNRYR